MQHVALVAIPDPIHAHLRFHSADLKADCMTVMMHKRKSPFPRVDFHARKHNLFSIPSAEFKTPPLDHMSVCSTEQPLGNVIDARCAHCSYQVSRERLLHEISTSPAHGRAVRC